MSSDIERHLTDLFQMRAESVMERANTQEKLGSLLSERPRDRQRQRRRWAAGGLVAAAAATTMVALVATGDTERAEPASPAGVDTVAFASSFLEAVYGGEPGRAEDMVAPDVEIVGDAAVVGPGDKDAWLDGLAWTRATDHSLAARSCRAEGSSEAGVEVHCTYAAHALGSDRLGRGPFGGNTIDLTILDGTITRIDEVLNYNQNGFSDVMWEPFASWVRKEHRADVPVMYTDDFQTMPRTDPRSLRLWEQRMDEYVAAKK